LEGSLDPVEEEKNPEMPMQQQAANA